MRRTLLDSLDAIDLCVCLFSLSNAVKLCVLAKEESIKGMLNMQRGFDAKDIAGFFGCHRSVCLLVFFNNAVKSYVFSRKKSLSKECSICREDLMRRTLPDSLDAIDPYVCLFSYQ